MNEVAMINQEKFRHPYHDGDMVFWFHDEEDDVLVTSYKSRIDRTYVDAEEEEEEEEEEEDIENENEENNNIGEERKAFWELQEELLQTTLYRTTSFEAKVRRAAKDALTKLNSGAGCSCRKTAAVNCWRCGLKEMSILLQNDGFNCVVCVSKWKSSSQIPAAGQHTYLEVMQSTESKRGEMKVIIELNFRAEFEMARSSQEYQNLVAKLPEIFVGKVERLRNLVKILCGASKKCMKERKMYVAPWRKYKYMQAKWQGKPLLQAAPPPVAVVPPKAQSAKRVSMLSFDFVETLLHNKAVEVI